MQSIVDRLTIRGVTKENTIFPNQRKYQFQLDDDESFKVEVETSKDIPRSELLKIKASNAYKSNPSEATILKLFRVK